MKDRLSNLHQGAVTEQPIMVHPLIAQRVSVGKIDAGFTPINQFLPFVLVRSVELFLASQPELVRMKEFETTLHVIEYSIFDVIERLIQ